MKDFLTSLGSVYWWLSVVIVGVLINLTSAYLKAKLDTTLSRFSARWRQNSKEEKSRRRQQIEALRTDPHEQTLMSISELRSYIECAIFLVATVLLYVGVVLVSTIPPDDPAWWPFTPATVISGNKIIRIVLMAVSTFTSFLFIKEFRDGLSKGDLVREAQKKTLESRSPDG